MALGVRFFGTERRSEGINFAKGHGHAFGFQLAGHGQRRGLLEEILLIIHFAVFGAGRIFEVQGGDAEHFPGAFAVAAGDQGRVDIHKALFLEKAVNGKGRRRTHPERRAERIGTRAQMGDGAQIFHGVAFFLQGIVGGGSAFHFDFLGMDFKGLLCLRREQQFCR